MIENVPPFWYVAIAIFVVWFLMAEFPRAGGALLVVLVLGLLLTAKAKGMV